MQSKEFYEAKQYEDDIAGAWMQALMAGEKVLAAQIHADLVIAQENTLRLFKPKLEPNWIPMRESLGLPIKPM